MHSPTSREAVNGIHPNIRWQPCLIPQDEAIKSVRRDDIRIGEVTEIGSRTKQVRLRSKRSIADCDEYLNDNNFLY